MNTKKICKMVDKNQWVIIEKTNGYRLKGKITSCDDDGVVLTGFIIAVTLPFSIIKSVEVL